MSDTTITTATILDGDGLHGEAFQRLYAKYTVIETVYGHVPLEVDDSDGELTVTIYDPSEVYESDDAPGLSTFGGNETRWGK